MKRNENESFEDYKKRRKLDKAFLKKKKGGVRLLWQSSKDGTYKKNNAIPVFYDECGNELESEK